MPVDTHTSNTHSEAFRSFLKEVVIVDTDNRTKVINYL